ncbi:hypothetical protein CEE45_16790 [Candidatus Heimdallarchaeota archaeon B3_Heim]|nr:MAG: hypothetical protein CEE45_16790 [Candidatus Heimdallarchaeota archaeon B3_Heim]
MDNPKDECKMSENDIQTLIGKRSCFDKQNTHYLTPDGFFSKKNERTENFHINLGLIARGRRVVALPYFPQF